MQKPGITMKQNRRLQPVYGRRLLKNIKANYELYILVSFSLAYYIIFYYVPMYGAQIAFRDYIPAAGFLGSKWVGLENFQRFFQSFNAWPIIRNTLSISMLSLFIGFPFPIILALMINEFRGKKYSKSLQIISYAPHFISIVAIVGMITIFFSGRGLINEMLVRLGVGSIDFLSSGKYFNWVYVLSSVWQEMGWGSIIFLAALSGIDIQLHEAAIIDGASKLKRIIHVDLPGIAPTIIILLVLRAGSIMSVGYEKVFLMQNPLNLSASEVISTYVYKIGLINADFSYSSAIGLFNSIINCAVLLLVNSVARRIGETSLW